MLTKGDLKRMLKNRNRYGKPETIHDDNDDSMYSLFEYYGKFHYKNKDLEELSKIFNTVELQTDFGYIDFFDKFYSDDEIMGIMEEGDYYPEIRIYVNNVYETNYHKVRKALTQFLKRIATSDKKFILGL